MVNNFVTEALTLVFIIQGNSSPSNYYLLPAPKRNLGGQKFEDDHDTPTVVARWPVTQGTN
jgi:hypothetical protein